MVNRLLLVAVLIVMTSGSRLMTQDKGDKAATAGNGWPSAISLTSAICQLKTLDGSSGKPNPANVMDGVTALTEAFYKYDSWEDLQGKLKNVLTQCAGATGFDSKEPYLVTVL